MAKIVPSGLIQDIKGSIGAYTYAGWKGIHYIRLKSASISNPNSPLQAKMRGSLADSVRLWWTLTAVQRALWAEYAQSLGSARADEEQMAYGGIIPPRGNIMTGFNAFCSLNQLLTSVNAARVLVPPISDPPVSCFIDAAAFVVGPPVGLTVTVKSTVPLLKDSYVQLWYDPVGVSMHSYLLAVSPVQSADALLDWTLVGYPTVRAGHDVNIEEVPWEDKFGLLPTGPYAGKFIGLLQTRLIDVDGAPGPASEARDLLFAV